MNFNVATRGRGRSAPVVRIAGLIDLVFLLLAFFLVTSALLEGESSVATALGHGQGDPAPVAPIVIEVQEGVWKIGPRLINRVDALPAVLEQLPKGPGIIIRPEGEVSAGAIVETVQEARHAGFTTLTLETPR
ncbi:MAG: biopolymer transporter ExbD [Phycisphaerales bacterium]|nr:biopolymer transporter ExbD [Phycisphaerales bacterium]